jgi:hypothetical protein
MVGSVPWMSALILGMSFWNYLTDRISSALHPATNSRFCLTSSNNASLPLLEQYAAVRPTLLRS